jgi:uncharacterized protein YprB with RNaseH-like and TPR domain
MLESTFQHIPGVGEKTERGLWSRGCTTWDRLLDYDFKLPSGTYRRLRAGVLESKSRLHILDHGYFRARLPGGLTWRAFNAFREYACFLDIETTGLSPVYDDVTTVCVHSLGGTESYVVGVNLHELKHDLEGFRYIVSFNGSRFDLPFLARRLGVVFHQLHLDVMYPLRCLGFRGGLKSIERRLGISRETEGVTGYDAVRLWRAYENDRRIEVAGVEVGGDDALQMLLNYNREDAVNLERLAEFVVEELMRRHRKLFD